VGFDTPEASGPDVDTPTLVDDASVLDVLSSVLDVDASVLDELLDDEPSDVLVDESSPPPPGPELSSSVPLGSANEGSCAAPAELARTTHPAVAAIPAAMATPRRSGART
jgi:hypothetical protein